MFTPPPGACDAHCHVFGPASRFPFAVGRSYTPPDAGVEQLEALHERMGLSRAVLVQASCHGTDNSAMVDALRRSPGRYAGVAMIDESCPDAELDRLHDAGVRGARFNFVRHLGGGDLGAFERTARRVAPRGWHMVVHLDAADLPDFAGVLLGLPCPFIIDHMARVPAAAGLGQPPFAALLGLMDHEGAWVKISGAERLTAGGRPPYDDVVPLAPGADCRGRRSGPLGHRLAPSQRGPHARRRRLGGPAGLLRPRRGRPQPDPGRQPPRLYDFA